MKQRFKQLLVAFALVVGLATPALMAPAAGAVNPIGDACSTNKT
jgi:hypothetical protein